MKGQLAPIDILRRERSKLTQELLFDSLDEKQWQKVYKKREKLNDEIAAMEAKK